MTAKERITVSLPADLVEGAKAAVESGEATDVSAYVADALAARRAKRESVRALDELFADLGRPAPKHDEWARRALGLGSNAAGQAAA
jgi:antitoxin ParD1/3/4